MLLAPLQWLGIGYVLASGVVSVSFERWSLQPVGLLFITWGSLTMGAATTGGLARLLWSAAAISSALAAVASVALWGVETWSVAGAALVLTASLAVAAGLAATTREHRMVVAARWVTFAWTQLFVCAACIAATVFARAVGWEVSDRYDGATIVINGERLALPAWAWPALISVALALLVLGIWAIVLFVATSREAKQSEHGEATPAAP